MQVYPLSRPCLDILENTAAMPSTLVKCCARRICARQSGCRAKSRIWPASAPPIAVEYDVPDRTSSIPGIIMFWPRTAKLEVIAFGSALGLKCGKPRASALVENMQKSVPNLYRRPGNVIGVMLP